MSPISGTWSFNGSYSTQRVASDNTPYRTYFALPLESIEGASVSRFQSYADSNDNGIYDDGDLLIGESVVQSFGSIGGSNGTFLSPEGSSLVYSYIGDKLVGQASFEALNPWGVAPSSGSASGERDIPEVGGEAGASATLVTTSAVDNLIGIKKRRDVFTFSANPQGQIDTITGFRAKEKDVLRISESSFGIIDGTFAIAKQAKALRRRLASAADIVYFRKRGELILNSNGAELGAGDTGGVFAILIGGPKISLNSVDFF